MKPKCNPRDLRGAHKTAAPRPRRVPNLLSPANRRLGKRLLQFYELPEPKRSRAFNAWLNSAGTPKRDADRKKRVREFFGLMETIANKLSARERASFRALGNPILAKAARKTPVKSKR